MRLYRALGTQTQDLLSVQLQFLFISEIIGGLRLIAALAVTLPTRSIWFPASIYHLLEVKRLVAIDQLVCGAAAGAPALLARVTAGPSNTAAPTAIKQYRVAGWRGPGSGLTWFSCLPALPRPFPASQVPVNPPPPAPWCFLVFFFRPKNTCFFSVF